MFRLLSLIISIIIFALSAMAAPNYLTLQGQIIDPNGQAVEGNSVNVTVEIYSPGSEQCLLYQEVHNLNMVNSSGLFSLKMGDGVQSGTDYEDTASFFNAFNNNLGPVSPTTCDSVGSYTPSASDGRKFRLIIDDGVNVINTALADVNSSPFAMSAASVGGLQAADILVVNTDASHTLDQASIDTIFENANYTELLALIGGTSTQYMVSAPTAGVDYNGQVITNLADPSNPTEAATKNYSDTFIGGQSVNAAIASLGAAQDGQVLVWDGVASEWKTQSPPAGLPTTGGTMTGNINMGGNDITNANDIALTNDLSVGNNVTVTGGIGVGTGINSSGPIQLTNQNELRLGDADNSNYVGFKAPDPIGANLVWTLPATDGTAGQILSTTGGGVLQWVTDDGGDFFADGSAAMTGDLDLGNHNIINLAGGSAAAPSLSFNADSNTGVFSGAGDTLSFTTAGSEAMTIDANGRVGVGVSAPLAKLELSNTSLGTNSLLSKGSPTVTANGTYYDLGVSARVQKDVNVGITDSGYAMGLQGVGYLNGDGTLSAAYGVRGHAGTFTSGTGTVTNSYAGYFKVVNQAPGTLTNGYGVYVGDGQATNSFGIYQEGSDDVNYFQGSVGIGTTGPITPLSVGPSSLSLAGMATNSAASLTATSASTVLVEGTSASSAGAGGGIAIFSNDGSAMASGDRLGTVVMGGSSSASSLRNTASVTAYAEQNWVDSSAYGTNL
ncbi:MAG: hypothetical protein KDD33_07570, partial [Bdellovibrionales bacterium]|nr:hypothetical protein [Bdellovibrionales bacterium]